MGYTIKPGDTLSRIAANNNTTIDRLMRDNPKIKDPNKIYAGDKLIIGVPQAAEDKDESKTFVISKSQSETIGIKSCEEADVKEYLASINIFVHGVNTDAAWFDGLETELSLPSSRDTATAIFIRQNFGFTWGDNKDDQQGGDYYKAADEIQQMFENPLLAYDRLYQGYSAVRLKYIIDKTNNFNVPVNVIAHSQGTLITLGALLLGAQINNAIFMGSPLDANNEMSQHQLMDAQNNIVKKIRIPERPMPGQIFNYYSSDDNVAGIKGGIGKYGDDAAYRKHNPKIINEKFDNLSSGHSDYMTRTRELSNSITEFSSFNQEVIYVSSDFDEIIEISDWENDPNFPDNTTMTDEEINTIYIASFNNFDLSRIRRNEIKCNIKNVKITGGGGDW